MMGPRLDDATLMNHPDLREAPKYVPIPARLARLLLYLGAPISRLLPVSLLNHSIQNQGDAADERLIQRAQAHLWFKETALADGLPRSCVSLSLSTMPVLDVTESPSMMLTTWRSCWQTSARVAHNSVQTSSSTLPVTVRGLDMASA
jgi:hypothetical protein